MEAEEVLERLVKLYHENRLSHAYLIETNNLDRCFNDLKKMIKKVLCPEAYLDNCAKCNLCNLIDNNYLPSFIVVEADGKNIKKEQILDLKSRFSSVPTFTKVNIYVIKEAEKLNASSANTMLKFLEEPDDNIIGFFITNNVNNVINTIKSRCEILNIKYKCKIDNFWDSTYFGDIYKYLKRIETDKNGLMFNKECLLSKYQERNDYLIIFQTILEVYRFVINNKRKNLNDEQELKLDFLEEQKMDVLLKKEKLIIDCLDALNYNVNVELFLDRFVIELSEINEKSI